MTSSPTLRRRARRIPLVAVFAIALLGGAACTPQQQIATIFGSRAPEAERVAHCESTMNPTAVSSTNDHGLFQINAVHERTFVEVTGQPWDMVYDGFWNTVYAKYLHDTQGWQPWSCRHAA
ncbi:MAG TPA: transglycosylase SLT domain-containing protein [Acidimicrobiales bacterium]